MGLTCDLPSTASADPGGEERPGFRRRHPLHQGCSPQVRLVLAVGGEMEARRRGKALPVKLRTESASDGGGGGGAGRRRALNKISAHRCGTAARVSRRRDNPRPGACFIDGLALAPALEGKRRTGRRRRKEGKNLWKSPIWRPEREGSKRPNAKRSLNPRDGLTAMLCCCGAVATTAGSMLVNGRPHLAASCQPDADLTCRAFSTPRRPAR